MKKTILILALFLLPLLLNAQVDTNSYQFKQNSEDGKYSLILSKKALNGMDSGKVEALLVHDIARGRDTIVFRDTLTSSKTFATYNLGSQYTYITIAITRGDTNKTNMDSIKTYSLSTYGDTAQTGLRNLLTFTDGQVGISGSSANSVVGYATQKYMLLDPICKFLHIRAVNAVLTNRIYILTIRAVRQ